MGQRYWVIGGEYRDCRFDEIEPGTEDDSRALPRRAARRGRNGSA